MIRRSQTFEGVLQPRRLAVITSHFNFAGFARPRANCLRFLRSLDRQGIAVYGAELTLPGQVPVGAGRRNWIVLQADPERHVMWQKEALLNLALARVPKEYTAIAWVDADLEFENPYWVEQTEQALACHDLVQPFHEGLWTAEDGSVERAHPACTLVGMSREWKGHPGFAWAARREVLTRSGGLYDRCLLGSADTVMAIGFMDGVLWPRAEESLGTRHDLYYRWRARLGRVSVGTVYGRVWHENHGTRENRRYNERIDTISGVDSTALVETDSNGLLAWTAGATAELKREVTNYFTERQEDG